MIDRTFSIFQPPQLKAGYGRFAGVSLIVVNWDRRRFTGGIHLNDLRKPRNENANSTTAIPASPAMHAPNVAVPRNCARRNGPIAPGADFD
ncbi:hypothetical protein [Rhizobium sp. F40D2]|uniref:hypothetical protein n=1 Tax=Rhizobium sp. F40D2 TaxID=3453141 RepID=UPI003F200CF6